MNCHAISSILDLHAEGRLTPKRAKAVAAHLESCAACRDLEAPVAAPAPAKAITSDFKSKLAASLKAQRAETLAASPEPKLELWPRDLSGVAFAAAALALIALVIGWSGVPSQKDFSGDELAAWRNQ